MIYLKYAQASGNHDQQIRLMSESAHSTSDDAEYGVDEQTKCGDAQQNIVQVGLFFRAELKRAHPAKRFGIGGGVGAPFHYSTTGRYSKIKTKNGKQNKRKIIEKKELKIFM